MLKFLRNIPILIFLIFFCLTCSHLIENKLNDISVEKKDIVFIGHSNMSYALNDSLISERLNIECKNYGYGGQSLFWSVISAKKHKAQGINNFIISLDEISYTTQHKTYHFNDGMKNMMLYKNYLNLNDWFFLFKLNKEFSMKSLFYLPIPTTKFAGKFNKGSRKFYDDLTKFNRDEIINTKDDILHKFIKNNPSSNFVIIKTPFHPNFYKKDRFKKNTNYLKSRLNSFQKYDNTLVLDYGNLIKNDSLFMDHSHINYKGAEIVSNKLAKILIKTEFFKN